MATKSKIKTRYGDEINLNEAIKRFDVSPIIQRFGTWAVTTFGLECLAAPYPIGLKRVDELDWLDHMGEKNWVDMNDFHKALSYARELNKRKKELLRLGRPIKVFLCHAKEDKQKVRELYNRLVVEGVEPWLDEESLIPGQDWKLEIPKAVRQSDIVLACLSKKAIDKTGFIQKEIRIALDAAEERPEGKIYLIPAKLEECEVPETLSKKHWVNLFTEDGFERLLSSFRAYVLQYKQTNI